MGKHGATVPSVRMMTLFCPARQFHSAKWSSPLGSRTIAGHRAQQSLSEVAIRAGAVAVPAGRWRRSRPEVMRMKAFISRRRCTEFTIW